MDPGCDEGVKSSEFAVMILEMTCYIFILLLFDYRVKGFWSEFG